MENNTSYNKIFTYLKVSVSAKVPAICGIGIGEYLILLESKIRAILMNKIKNREWRGVW